MTRAATQPTTPPGLTLEDYLATPETMRRQEVIDGVIVTMPSPTFLHQWILLNLYRLLFAHVSTGELGVVLVAPFDILICTEPRLRMRQPDVMYFSAARAGPGTLMPMRYGEVAPDLAIEILSDSDRQARWAEKLADYASIAISEVWRVEPEASTVEVLGLFAGRYERSGRYGPGEEVRSVVLPGLALAVAAIFA